MSDICYAPNAVPVPEYGPCNNNTDSVSLCCSPGQFCLTNGLCANGQGEFYSGACTDKTYKASICPSFCMGASKYVVQCKGTVIPDGEFCCDANGSGSCCNSASNAMDLALAVTSATVAPTANFGPTTTTSSFQSPSSSGTSARSTLSSTTLAERTTSSGIGSTGSTRASDTISTRSTSSTTTATLVSASPSVLSKASNNRQRLGYEIGFPVGGLVILTIIAAVLYPKYKNWRRTHDGKFFPMRSGRIVNHDPSNSEIKVEPIELGRFGLSPTRPAELDSGSNPRAPLDASGLSPSQENIDRLAAIPKPVPWDPGHPGHPSRQPPATPTLRPNNPQGPLPLPAFPTVQEDDSRGFLPPAGSAIAQTDGASTPPPAQTSTETNNRLQVPSAIVPFHTERFDGFVTLDGEASDGSVLLDGETPDDAVPTNGEASDGTVRSDSAASDGIVPSNGIVAPPNSEAPSSTLVNSSPPSTKSYDSNTKTVLDVGCVLHTAETESEQGDVSSLPLAEERTGENELSQYLGFVGWQPRHENAPTAVGGIEAAASSESARSEAMDSKSTDSSVAPSESADVRSAHTDPVLADRDATLAGLPKYSGSI